jgi:predicted RNA binding protein YcfA (HicA-like mRNA interferase family)
MKAKELLALLKRLGCIEVRQRGSHVVVRCGQCMTVVPVHAGRDLGTGLLHEIHKGLEPCLGSKWWKR